MKNCIVVFSSFIYNDEGYDKEEGVQVIPILYTEGEAQRVLEEKTIEWVQYCKDYLPYQLYINDIPYDALVRLGIIFSNIQESRYGDYYYSYDLIIPKLNYDDSLEFLRLLDFDDIYKIIELKQNE